MSGPRRRLDSLGVVAVSVAAVVAVLVVPAWFAGSASSGPVRPRPDVPTRTVDDRTAGTRDWTAITCPDGEVGCAVPVSLNLGGVRFVRVRGHQQEVSQRDPSTRTLTRTVRPAGGKRWLLVGAQGASSGAELGVRLGAGQSSPIPAGTLSLLSVPGERGKVVVTVTEYGRANGKETLHIEEYDARG